MGSTFYASRFSKLFISLYLSFSLPVAHTLPYPDDPPPSGPPPSDAIRFPSGPWSENPFPSGIPTLPDQCDPLDLSEECVKTMGSSGGYLYFETDNQCSDEQKATLETAVWDATTLAGYASTFPDAGTGNKGPASGNYYMGPDFPAFQGRIAGNLKRAWQFKTPETGSGTYITISCNDKYNTCTVSKDPGLQVGGYGWDYTWLGMSYAAITLCAPFFTIDSLSVKLDEIELDLRTGNPQAPKAGDMDYLKNTGQFFLHEMMHTKVAVGNTEPHIDDKTVNTETGKKAYGPYRVHTLATSPAKMEGGAKTASLNADSYAMLANAIWWWETTNMFPAAYAIGRHPRVADASADPDGLPISVRISLDNTTHPKTADFGAMFATAFADASQGFGGPDPEDPPAEDDGSDDPAKTNEPPPPPDTPPDAAPSEQAPAPADPPPPPPPPAPADTCGLWYKFFFNHFEIFGKDFDAAKLGADGSGLQQNIQHCGAISDWTFEQLANDPQGYQWKATGNLPIGTKSCVGSAVVAAGGSTADGCTGAG